MLNCIAKIKHFFLALQWRIVCFAFFVIPFFIAACSSKTDSKNQIQYDFVNIYIRESYKLKPIQYILRFDQDKDYVHLQKKYVICYKFKINQGE